MLIRHADMEIIVMKEEACYVHRPLETGSPTHNAGLHGKHWGWPGGRGSEGKMCPRVLLFLWERTDEVGVSRRRMGQVE